MSKVLEKASKMVSAQAREMLCAIAGQRDWNDTRESWLARAARKLGFGHRRTKAIFYGEARVISADEWLRLNETLAALSKSAAARREEINDLQALSSAADAAAFDRVRPLGVAGDAAGKEGFRTKR